MCAWVFTFQAFCTLAKHRHCYIIWLGPGSKSIYVTALPPNHVSICFLGCEGRDYQVCLVVSRGFLDTPQGREVWPGVSQQQWGMLLAFSKLPFASWRNNLTKWVIAFLNIGTYQVWKLVPPPYYWLVGKSKWMFLPPEQRGEVCA